MEENKANEPAPLTTDQVNQVAGGDGCTTTISAGSTGVNFQTSGPSPGDVLISTYDGLVDATSHVIETVANSLK
jgi:hypothetical protein